MSFHAIGSLAAIACLTASVPAIAQEAPLADRPDAEMSATAFFSGSAVVDEDVLRKVAGREDVVQAAQANLRAGVSNNSIGDNAVTGQAKIDGNAFQNMSGLSILNINTGNNVAINAAMNVNISITPMP